jgi:mannobiose 2-epimerase
MLREQAQALQSEFSQELARISEWWSRVMPDEDNGGFIGAVSSYNKRMLNSEKGIILNARILWFFSDLANYRQDDAALALAKRAYDYLYRYFYDIEHGGFFWSLDACGEVIDDKKQTYAQAFALYGIISYYRASGDQSARTLAQRTFDLIETRCKDKQNGGYLEAFRRDWAPIEDMRLSEKDDNLPKSQNTHLHVLEAYTNLHNIDPSPKSDRALRSCVEDFMLHIVDSETWHLRMFMDEQWRDHSQTYSFGHDIEFSWLLYKALVSLNEEALIKSLLPAVLKIAQTCLDEGRGSSGEVLDEYDLVEKKAHRQSVWWVQAEAMVGFLNAFTLSSEKRYFEAFEAVWCHTKKEHLDLEGGEWHWLALKDQGADYDYDKACFWKAPYHNGRAMMEVIKLLEQI